MQSTQQMQKYHSVLINLKWTNNFAFPEIKIKFRKNETFLKIVKN